MTLGIVVALPEELATLTRNKPAQGDCVALNSEILICYAGAGPSNAELAARSLIAQGCQRLMSWGCAGALSPQLNPGDLVLASQVLFNEQRFDTHPHWQTLTKDLLSPELTIYCETLSSSTSIIASSKEKHYLHQQTGAFAIDMESAAIAAVSKEFQLPFLIVRAIADPVTMDLPNAVSHALNPQGRVELGKLLGYLLRHPTEVSGLIRLGLHFNSAQKTLKHAAKQLHGFTNF